MVQRETLANGYPRFALAAA